MERQPISLEEWKEKAAASPYVRKGEIVTFTETQNRGNIGISATIENSLFFIGHYFLSDRDKALEGTGWIYA